MAAFSTAANAFAVVGLADVVFKATTELYDRTSKLRNAAQNINAYHSELKQFAELIAQIRTFVSDFASSPSTTDDGRCLKFLQCALQNCQVSLDRMRGFVNDVTTTAQDRWINQLMKNTRWVWSDQKVQRMCQELERHKTALLLVMSHVGREDSLFLRQQHKATRDDLAAFQAATDSNFQVVKQHLASSSNISTQEMRNVTTAIQLVGQNNQDSFGRVLMTGDGIRHDTQRLSNQLSAFQATFDRLVNISPAMEGTDYPVVDHDIDLDQVAMALTLAKSNFGCLPSALNDPDMSFNLPLPIEVMTRFLQVELKQALVYSHRIAADAASQTPRGIAIPQDYKSPTLFSRDRKNGMAHFSESLAKRRRRSHAHEYSATSTTGKLHLTWAQAQETTYSKDTPVHVVELTFLPHPHIPACGVSIISAVVQLDTPTPPVARWIRPFGIRSRFSDAVHYALEGDIVALHGLFRAGKASAHDRDEDGTTLLSYACYNLHDDMYNFLIQEGADPLEYRSSSGLEIAWSIALLPCDLYSPSTYGPPTLLTFNDRLEICRSMSKATQQHDSDLSGLGLVKIISAADNERSIVQVVEMLTSMGYDLESTQGYLDSTMWLNAVEKVSEMGCSCDLVRLLADHGADIRSTNRHGNGALAYFFGGYRRSEGSGMSAVLEDLEWDVLWTVGVEDDQDFSKTGVCEEDDHGNGTELDEGSDATNVNLGDCGGDSGHEIKGLDGKCLEVAEKDAKIEYLHEESWSEQEHEGGLSERDKEPEEEAKEGSRTEAHSGVRRNWAYSKEDYTQDCDGEKISANGSIYHRNHELETRMKNRLRILKFLLKLGIDPNQRYHSFVISTWLTMRDDEWWMWTSILAETGYELHTRGAYFGEYFVVKAAEPYRGPSVLDRRFLFTYGN